jgi:homoprotocatechuate degradation regulator HpaR
MSDFDNSLPMILHRTLDAIMPPYRELFARHDLTEQQWRIMRVLWSEGKVTSVELSQRTLLAPASLVGILDRLEKKGLISRVRSTTDRRAVHVLASPEGRELAEVVIPEVQAIQARIRACVSDAEWQSMQATLAKISQRVDEQSLDDAANY